MRTWLLIPLLSLTAPARAAEPVPGAPSPPAKPVKQPAYTIDDKPVTEAEFAKKRDSLHGQNRYSCMMTTTGGINSYEAQDAAGAWFLVVQGTEVVNQIRAIPGPDPKRPVSP